MVHRVALAMQGGGTHGAFTWGVLDRLLDEVAKGRLEIAALSGSSAGAVNGALCACGLSGGMTPDNAKKTKALLAAFWQSLSERALLGGNPFSSGIMPNFFSGWNQDWNPVAIALEMMSLVFSPYNFPLYSNPLIPLLADFLPADAFAAINHSSAPKLHVCAVNVGDNQRKLFTQPKLSIETLLASACLPSQFRAIDIDNKFYWDGGYIGNPALEPLLKSCQDIIVVMVNPLRFAGVPPQSARQILDRLNDISFNAPLVLEINAIHAVNKLLDKLPDDQADATGYRKIRLHFIRNEKAMEPLGFVGKSNASFAFLQWLFDVGRETADHWVTHNFSRIGEASTCNWKGLCNLEKDIIDPVLKAQ
ncbi:MAG: patatin-like phospholipase family protein [Pseudomonadota bacterium]